MTLPDVDSVAALRYFAGTVRQDSWDRVQDQDALLLEAQRWLGLLCYDQTRDCCGRDFATSYESAVCELALALSLETSTPLPAAVATGYTKRQKLGDLEIEFFEGGQNLRYGPQAPTILQRYPWLGDILNCWLSTSIGTGRILDRVRS